MKKIVFLMLIFITNQLLANDPLFHRQWALENNGQSILIDNGELTRENRVGIQGLDINWVNQTQLDQIIKEKQLSPSQKDIVVAVIDSGVDIQHPELRDRIWFNDKLCSGLSESEQNGQPCYGWNFLENKSDISDDVGHGTHVAGIIAANHDGRGIQGAAPSTVKIMPLKVLNRNVNNFTYQGQVITNIIADAISFAVQNGADVINLSLGWPQVIHMSKIIYAIERAQELGVLIIAATGNNNKDVPTYPCTMKGVICVGAHDHRGELTEFSNYSGKVDLAAPGEEIVSLNPQNLESRTMRIQGLEVKRGSSQAAPYVSAVAAALKWLYPTENLAQIKARLLHSSLPLAISDKQIKYGRLNMRGAIEMERPQFFIEADFKGLLEIEVQQNGRFSFELPIVNSLETIRDIEVQISLDHPELALDQTTYAIERMGSNIRRVLRIQGEVLNLNIDSDHHLKVEINFQGKKQSTQTRVVFMRKLNSELQKVNLPAVHPELISFFNGPQKVSRLRRVSTKFEQEWFFQDPRKPLEISVLRSTLNSADFINLELDQKMNQILALIKVDIDRDGQSDYMVYAMNEARTELVLSFFNADGEALFGQFHQWHFPLSAFEGLPLQNGLEDFAWLAIDHKELGKILVPSFKRAWILADEDNTFDFLDRLPHGVRERAYYLNPEIEQQRVVLHPRAIESFQNLSQIRRKLNISELENIAFSKPLEQSEQERMRGEISFILSTGVNAQKRHHLVRFRSPQDFDVQNLALGAHFIEGNLVKRLQNVQNMDLTDHLSFMVLISREKARILTHELGQQRLERTQQTNHSYGDPFFNYLGGLVDGAQKLHFLESRYAIYALDQEGQVQSLPINRDSSFPGMSFSETLKPITVSGQEGPVPAIYVNATLVFGDRLYAMTMVEGKFLRPISLSFSFPANCLHLEAHTDAQGSFATLLCRDQSQPLDSQMSLQRFDLNL